MAKKKSVKKDSKKRITKKISKVKTVRRIPKKKVIKKITKKVRRRVKPSKVIRANKSKIILILSRLIFFAGLALISFILSFFLTNEMFDNLFLMLTILFGFIAVGFLIVLLIFFILRILRK